MAETWAQIVQIFWGGKGAKSIMALILGGLGTLIGGVNESVTALLTLFAVDFILGFYVAYKKGRIQMSKLRGGAIKFILYGITLIVGSQLDIILGTTGPIGFRNMMLIYLAATEALSCIKHLAILGIKVPTKLIAKLTDIQIGK